MELRPTNRAFELREFIEEFLSKRLEKSFKDKSKLLDDGSSAMKKEEILRLRSKLESEYQREEWLSARVKNIHQIQVVSHVVKATRPDLKISEASSLYVQPQKIAAIQFVGSHCLDADQATVDVTGNASESPTFEFLSLFFEGKTLYELILSGDEDLLMAMSDDKEIGKYWMQCFAKVTDTRTQQPTAHTFAKQLYWPVFSDVGKSQSFHLLEPLYPSILVQKFYEHIQSDLDGAKLYRLSKSKKAANVVIELTDVAKAWQAKEKLLMHELPVSVYPSVAIQKIGGQSAKSQGNVSKLNQMRQGNNYLLASVPPQWVSQPLKPLLNTESMFGRYGRRAEVKTELRALLQFLKTDPPATLPTRNQRAKHVNALLLEFLQFTTELRELDAGWVAQPDCKLKVQQAFWLDPDGATQQARTLNEALPTDVMDVVSEDFALWFNHQLRDTPAGSLPVGDSEYHVWRKLCEEALKAYERGGLEEAMSVLDIHAEELANAVAQNTKQEVPHV